MIPKALFECPSYWITFRKKRLSEREIILTGGNTSGRVVQVGNTVRKNVTKHSQTVHRLLQHLENKAFDFSPRFLGLDSSGRETLSFIEGETGIPSFIWESDETLQGTAAILRKLHDATLDFQHMASDDWSYCAEDLDHREVICHNDFAPYNTVYQMSRPVGIIDFDLAGPGLRLRDLAYSAYWNVPLSVNDTKMKKYALQDVANANRRLVLFCEAYGTECNEALLDMVQGVLTHMGSESKAVEMIGLEKSNVLKNGGHFEHWHKESAVFSVHKKNIASAFKI